MMRTFHQTLVFLVLFVRSSVGVIGNLDFSSRFVLSELTTFHFAPGGTFSLSLIDKGHTEDQHIEDFIALCPQSEFQRALAEYGSEVSCSSSTNVLSLARRCAPLTYLTPYGNATLVRGGASLRCGSPARSPASHRQQLSYDLQNVGGEHLSEELLPLPDLATAMLVLYIVITVAWVAHWGYFHRFRVYFIHATFTTALLAKVGMLAFMSFYWRALSDSGVVSRPQLFVLVGTVFAHRVLLFGLIFTVGKGYNITRRTLRVSEVKALCLMTLIVSGSLALYDLDSSGAFYLLQGFLRFSAHTGGFVAAVIGVKYFHVDITHIIAVLTLHRAIVGEAAVQHRHNVVLARLRLLRAFRSITVLFLAALAVLQVFVIFLLSTIGWYEDLVLEGAEVLWTVAACYVLRLRSFDDYRARPARRSRAPLKGLVGDGSLCDRVRLVSALESGELDDDGLFVLQLPPSVDTRQAGAAQVRVRPTLGLASLGELSQRLVERKARMDDNANAPPPNV